MSNPSVYVCEGDLTKLKVDAIVTLINSGGMWFGGLDNAISRVAGTQYHNQAQAVDLHNGQVVVAKKKGLSRGRFEDVIFVVDDLESPLGDLVYAALSAAEQQGYKSVGFPLMRTGVMLGEVEPDVAAVIQQMKAGIARFWKEGERAMDIYIVVYDDPRSAAMLLQDGSMLRSMINLR